MAQNSDTRVITGPKTRLSYVHVFEKWAREGDEPRYSVTLLIPKDDKTTLAALKKARDAAIAAKWGTSPPKGLKSTIKDGDDEEKYDHDTNPEVKGHLLLAVSSKNSPGVVDTKLQPILDSTEVYSGCYARVSINAFPFEHPQGGKGVSFGLNNIMKVAEGEFLGGRSRPEDDFAEFAGEAYVGGDDGDMADLL